MSLLLTMGATHNYDRQEDDFYATSPEAAEHLMQLVQLDNNIWECACGSNHLANVFKAAGYNVRCSDIVDRCGNEVLDFLSDDVKEWHGDIVTNPPYKYAKQFVEKALSIIPEGNKVAMFLRLQFLEGQRRREFFKQYKPKTVYVASKRIKCAKDGDFDKFRASAVSYAWFVWEKGYSGDTIVKWFN